MEETREITRHDLKVNALLERLANLENEKAEVRVDLTIVANENERLKERIKELEALVENEESSADAN